MADYLEDIDPYLCVRYLEYLIQERGETSTTFHERLAELYLSLSRAEETRGDNCEASLPLFSIDFEVLSPI